MESDEDFRDESHKKAVEQVKQYLLRIMPSGFDLSHFALEKIFVDHGISHVAKLVSTQIPLQLKIGEAGQLYFEEASGKKHPKIDLDPETVQEAIAVFVRSGFIQLGISLSCAVAKLLRLGIISGDVYKMFFPVRKLLPDLQYALPREVRKAFKTVFPFKSVDDDFIAANKLLLERFFKSTNVSHASLIAADGELGEVGQWVEILAQIDVDPIHLVWAGNWGATPDRTFAVYYLGTNSSVLEAVWSTNAITGLFMACVLRDLAEAQNAVLPTAFDTCIVKCLTQHFPDEIPPYCRSSVQKMSKLPPAQKSKLLGLPEWHAESAGASHPAPMMTSTSSMTPKSSTSTTTTTTTTTTSSNAHPSPTVSSTGHANQPLTNVAGSTANHSGTVPSTWKSASPSKNQLPNGTTTTTSTPSTTTTTTSTSSTSSSKQPPPKGGSS